MRDPLSLQMVGSKALGGAERWFARFARALAETGVPAQAVIRAGSELEGLDLGSLRVHRLPFRTVWDPWSSLAVNRLVSRLKPDLVQTYMGRATRLARLTPGRGPVHVARLGGYYALHPYRRAHAWIGNTKGLCDWMVRNGLPASGVHHIYNFVDPGVPTTSARIGQLRRALAVPDDAWVLVTAGRFVPVKGQRYLIDALARLPAEVDGRPLRLVVLGDGVLGEELRQRAESCGVAQRVLWAGWRADPGPYFQMADLVVFPSLEEETLGNVILESWAWSRPLVTSLFRGAREIARHGEDAWCVPCADPVALAQGIRAMLEDRVMAGELARAGYARVQGEFSRRSVMERYLELYRRLTGAAA